MLPIAVLNVKKSQTSLNKEETEWLQSHGLLFKTCLREMCIIKESDALNLPQSLLDKNYTLYKGYEALDYTIKVLSGFESPVLGETEVLGQFKDQVLPQLKTKSKGVFQEPVQFVLKMVKNIRTKHFVGQGAQTYGGLVRKLLKSEDQVLFVGAGSFAESIYPWVKTHKTINFSVRDPDKYKGHKDFKDHDFYTTNTPLDIKSPLSVVVCSPISAKDLKKHLSHAKVNTVIDLRETSKVDPVIFNQSETKTFILEEVFSEISKALDHKTEIKAHVSKEIKEKLFKELTKYRPFGWDDMYAH